MEFVMTINKLVLFTFLSFIGLNSSICHSASSAISEHWVGSEYKENALLQANWADRFFFKHYDFKGNEAILDIGSGDGKLTARIADLTAQGKVIGIDNSELMLKEAKKHAHDRKNLLFVMQDAEDIRFYQQHANQFDLIVSFSTMHWLKNQQAVLQGIQHALKKNGKCYLKLSSKGGDPMQEIADQLATRAKYKDLFKQFNDPMTRFSPDEYKKLLHDNKLTLISIKDSEEKDQIKGRANLIKQIKSWLPHYHYLKQRNIALAEQYINEVIDTYLKQFPADKENNITLYDHYLEVVATKA